MHMNTAGSELGNMLPTHHRYWWPLVEDIFKSPGVDALQTVLMNELESHTEFTTISVDATLRCCMTVMGQAHHKASAACRAESAFGDSDSLRRVLSIRGRTGAVLGMIPLPAENAEHVATAIQTNLSNTAKAQVRFIACDNPSAKLWESLCTVLPNLEIMCLDPVHLPIVYEYSTWRVL